MNGLECVLFDLDGTLADTAPDLAAALNRVREEEGMAPVGEELTRPVTSQGVRGLLQVGFGLQPEDEGYPLVAQRLLAHYEAAICRDTRLFEGMDSVISVLENRQIKWGIVTNKHARFTVPLVSALGLEGRTACVVSGDTAARPKPFPDPLLHACVVAGVSPESTAYVGDDIRDIAAGRAACMHTLAAAWGYLGEAEPIEKWGADAIVASPANLLEALDELSVR
jgi:phosphoglycolate phosphatase